jgi:hypothetical protein
MLDDGVKGAGVEDDQVKVGDIAIHLLEAIENGERGLANPGSPLIEAAESSSPTPVAGE